MKVWGRCKTTRLISFAGVITWQTAGVTEKVLEANPGLSNQIFFECRAGDRNARDNQRGGTGSRPVMGMTLDRINEYFAFATSAPR